MKLADYLKTKQITYEKFSEMSGIPYNTLVKHVHKQRIPSQNYMKKYYQLTNGMVTPSDFFDIVEDSWEWQVTYQRDFSKAYDDAKKVLEGIDTDINPIAFSVIVEMVSQMGYEGVSKFVKLHDALKNKDYQKAAQEMLDSRWGKQTPKIAYTLAEKMRAAAE